VLEADSFGVALLVRGEKELLLDEWLIQGASEQAARAMMRRLNDVAPATPTRKE
jgi:hypothetical protein